MGLQAVFPGRAMTLAGFNNLAQLWARFHNCSWSGRASGCAPQLDGGTFWTPHPGGVPAGICGWVGPWSVLCDQVGPRSVLCDQVGPQAMPQGLVEPQLGLCNWVGHWLCSCAVLLGKVAGQAL